MELDRVTVIVSTSTAVESFLFNKSQKLRPLVRKLSRLSLLYAIVLTLIGFLRELQTPIEAGIYEHQVKGVNRYRYWWSLFENTGPRRHPFSLFFGNTENVNKEPLHWAVMDARVFLHKCTQSHLETTFKGDSQLALTEPLNHVQLIRRYRFQYVLSGLVRLTNGQSRKDSHGNSLE